MFLTLREIRVALMMFYSFLSQFVGFNSKELDPIHYGGFRFSELNFGGKWFSLFPRLFASFASALAIATTISIEDNLPYANLSYFGSDGELQTVTISDLTKGKKAIFFIVPGPLRQRARRSTSLDLWKRLGSCMLKADEVLLLSDRNREFTLALGVELDLSDKPMALGVRSRRYALLAEDGVVKVLNLEDGGLASFVEYIPYARVPLLKYISRQHNISFDVSVNNHLGVMKSNVLKWLSEIDDRFRDMLKEWAKAQDINDPKSGSLSSYVLCLLVIFHFQLVDDLSTLQIEDPFERMENAARIVRWVGGRDTVLVDALSRCIPLVSDQPTIIFGADITHPHPGEDSSPSIAVVSCCVLRLAQGRTSAMQYPGIYLFPSKRLLDKSLNRLYSTGIIVDSKIGHPTEFDFYLCNHASIQVVDLLVSYQRGRKIGLFDGAGMGKTRFIMELMINNIEKSWHERISKLERGFQ
ncbi:hypothetical protein ZIOFF_034206 [Zingiber officinale]|uniref:glutaredoxin-dependent peroxiredoxin n=1 Tax=Zingiber officinale TaxID=94328 RepID=A0A8J5H3D9_ZINOF|nr:hypothetical protein ZIOFF_034206 [Zingiber officinale]